MFINSVNMAIGFLIISLACTFNTIEASFFISLFASVILGTVSALGESTTLGFCKGFPSTVVGYFGSGTGFAGIFGSGMILILQSAGLSDGAIFFIITPTVIPYFLAFWWISRIKAKYPYIEGGVNDQQINSGEMLDEDNSNNIHDHSELVNGSHIRVVEVLPTLIDEAKDNKALSYHELKRIFFKVGFF